MLEFHHRLLSVDFRFNPQEPPSGGYRYRLTLGLEVGRTSDEASAVAVWRVKVSVDFPENEPPPFLLTIEHETLVSGDDDQRFDKDFAARTMPLILATYIAPHVRSLMRAAGEDFELPLLMRLPIEAEADEEE